MEINQKDHEFQPITITLENRREAGQFFRFIDKCDQMKSVFTIGEKRIVTMLSNSLTEMEVTI